VRYRGTFLSSAAPAVLAVLVFAACAQAQESQKPLLSEEIRAALEAGGPEGAQSRFDEVFPDQADRYEIDLEGMYALASEKMLGGDPATVEALMGMVLAISQAQIGAAMPELAAAAEAEQRKSNQESAEQTQRTDLAGPGPARDDLRRFRGQYGLPGQNPPRNFLVEETCDGYLVAGPMWADVSLWHLTSVADNKFEYEDSFTSVTITFEVADDGTPLSMSHTVEGVTSPVPFLGPLPAEWGEECLTVDRERHG
jgi:hypothetical protein